jgi:hypothetical protein
MRALVLVLIASCGSDPETPKNIVPNNHFGGEERLLRKIAGEILRKGELDRDDDARLKDIVRGLCEVMRSARKIEVDMKIDKSSMFADAKLNLGFKEIGCAQAIARDGKGLVFSFEQDRWIPET